MSYGCPSIGLYFRISIIHLRISLNHKMMYVPMECRFIIYSLFWISIIHLRIIYNVFMDILNSFMDILK